MSDQRSFAFGHDPRWAFEEMREKVMDAARALIDVATRKEVCHLSDTRGSHLDNALRGEADRNYLMLKQVVAALVLASQDERIRFLSQLGAAWGIEAVERERVTPEERLAKLEAEVRRVLSESAALELIGRAQGRR